MPESNELATNAGVYTGRMKELVKRVDPNWLRIWLACYGGSLTVLAAYFLSVLAEVGFERRKNGGIAETGNC